MSIELLIKRLRYAENRFGLLQEGAVLIRFVKLKPEEAVPRVPDVSIDVIVGLLKLVQWAVDVEVIRNESDPSLASLSPPPPPHPFYEFMLKEAGNPSLFILMLEKVEDIPNALDQFLKLESENAEDILKEFDKLFPDSEATKSEAADDLIFIFSAQSPEFIWSFRKRIEELLQKITNLAAKLQNSGNDVGSKGGDNIRGEGNDKVSSGDNNNGGGGDDSRDDGDGDDNNGGGGRDNDGGSGGNDMKKDGGNDDDGNSDKDKGGSSSSDRKRMGNQMDFMGEPGFGYRYGYHAGDENGFPVGQFHHAKKPTRFLSPMPHRSGDLQLNRPDNGKEEKKERERTKDNTRSLKWFGLLEKSLRPLLCYYWLTLTSRGLTANLCWFGEISRN